MKRTVFIGFAVAAVGMVSLGLLFSFRVDIKQAVESFLKPSLPAPLAATEFSALVPAVLPPAPKSPTQIFESAINLSLPFASQAPFGDWALPYQETCEEASAIMVHRYFSGETLDPQIMDDELKKLIAWEEKTFGYYTDTTAEEIARILREYFGHKDVEVVYEFTMDDVKRAVSQGHPVILPAAGRLLGNPNFRQPGPIYHALVVKGFIGKKIITNDPGTHNGKDFLYNPEVLMNAIHDWNSEDILKGRKAMVVVKS